MGNQPQYGGYHVPPSQAPPGYPGQPYFRPQDDGYRHRNASYRYSPMAKETAIQEVIDRKFAEHVSEATVKMAIPMVFRDATLITFLMYICNSRLLVQSQGFQNPI